MFNKTILISIVAIALSACATEHSKMSGSSWNTSKKATSEPSTSSMHSGSSMQSGSSTEMDRSMESGSSMESGGTTTSAPPTAPSTAAAMASTTPSEACRSMVASAKAKNFEGFMKMTTAMPERERRDIKGTKGSFQKMHAGYMDRLQDLSCGSEVIATDHAVVESESKGERRLIPFVKTNEGWRFDMGTYQSFYHTEEKEMARKKRQ